MLRRSFVLVVALAALLGLAVPAHADGCLDDLQVCVTDLVDGLNVPNSNGSDPIVGEHCSALAPETYWWPAADAGALDGDAAVAGTASWTFIYHYCWWQHASGRLEAAYGYPDVSVKTGNGWRYLGTDSIYNYVDFQGTCWFFKFRGHFSFLSTLWWNPENKVTQHCIGM